MDSRPSPWLSTLSRTTAGSEVIDRLLGGVDLGDFVTKHIFVAEEDFSVIAARTPNG